MENERLNHHRPDDSSLFPEDELRRHLHLEVAQSPDIAFEAAVLARVQRPNPLPELTFAGTILLVLIVSTLWCLWGTVRPSLPAIMEFVVRDLQGVIMTALDFLAKAPLILAAHWELLRQTFVLGFFSVIAATLALEITTIIVILKRRKVQL